MPIFRLKNDGVFPDPRQAEESGILAIGGELNTVTLLNAYANGVFPWYNPDEVRIWWCPDPRYVIFPSKIKVSDSMRRILKSGKFKVTMDTCFHRVINACRYTDRKNEDGTWITDEFIDAYTEMYHLGLCHSVEVWEGDELVGGLYGMSLGNCFFGESMFSKVSNASKVGLIMLAQALETRGFAFIDCQIPTPHLESMGAEPLPREEFLRILQLNLSLDTFIGRWNEWEL